MGRIKVTAAILLVSLLFACISNTPSVGTETPTGSAPTATVPRAETPATLTPAPNVTATAVPSVPPGSQAALATLSDAMAAVVARVAPAVVFISVEFTATTFFGRTTPDFKSGSGVIMSPDGYILTNNHVIEDYTTITVALPNDPMEYNATLVGSDPTSDLAVIKIEGRRFPFAEFGDASQLRVGNLVIAVGNPEGLEGGPTITDGVVSNLERSFSIDDAVYYDVIQTSAPINPGNSGGPLVDVKEGKVIGINSFILSQAQGLGFAIGSDTTRKVYSDLVAQGKVVRPFLGAGLQTVTPPIVRNLNLARNVGVVIVSLDANGPAARAGMQVNDVIVAINGQEVNTDTRLLKVLWLQYKAGDQVRIAFWRGNQQQEVSVTLAERPQ